MNRFVAIAALLLCGFDARGASPEGSTVPIIDNNGHSWQLVGGVVQEDGKPAGYSANVTRLVLHNGTVYQTNAAGGWWQWSGSAWVATTNPAGASGSSSSSGGFSTSSGSGGSGSSASSSGAPAAFGVRAAGARLASTLNGAAVELIGMNMSGCETPPASRCVAIAGATQAFWQNTFRGAHAGTNTVRLPADAVNTNLALYEKAVDTALTAGLYVIVDLHWSAPTGQQSIGQPGFPDADHAIAFWKAVADAFKNNPAVIFELFNEPFADNVYGDATGTQGLTCLAAGCSYAPFCHQNNGDGNKMQCVATAYQVAGELQLLAAIRGEGAQNLVLLSPPWWAGEIEFWLQAYAKLADANTCASMHAYSYNKGMGPLNAVQAAGHCIVITEFTSPVGNLGAAGPLQALGIGTVSWGPSSWSGQVSMTPTGW